MRLLDAETAPEGAAPDTRPAGAGEPSGATDAPARACRACGARMEPEQDWCLDCGTAAPGRLGARPGWRAAVTVACATLALVAASVAAAYAALTTDATQEAAAPAPPVAAPIAQAPPATPTSAAQPPVTTSTSALPKVEAPSSGSSSSGSSATPVHPQTTSTPTAAAPPTTSTQPHPRTPPTTSTPTTGSTGSGAPNRGGERQPREAPATITLPRVKGLVAVELPPDAGALYDPDQQADTPGDPALALDDDPTTSFQTGAKTPDWGLGYLIDLQGRRGVQRVRIKTDTPGFKVEVYVAAGKTPPATILDPAWVRLHDEIAIGATKETQTVELGDGSTKFRHLLVWITAGPPPPSRIDLSEVRVLG